jgi:hypothetical protein
VRDVLLETKEGGQVIADRGGGQAAGFAGKLEAFDGLGDGHRVGTIILFGFAREFMRGGHVAVSCSYRSTSDKSLVVPINKKVFFFDHKTPE